MLRNIRDWLLGNHIDKLYDASIQIRQTGTCDWIFENDKFKNWQSLSSPPQFFWIKGAPGFGKTILCARIIQHIKAKSEEVVAHYFFSSDLESHKDPMVAMQSWIYHIAEKNESVASIVNKIRLRGGPASRTVITELFRKAIKMVPNCTLVIDGLDECDPGKSCISVIDFIKEVNKAVQDTSTRVLVMSRPENGIREALKVVKSANFSEHALCEDDVRSDIEALSKAIVTKKLEDKDITIQAKMTKMMSDRSQGQFIWLRVQNDSLPEALSQEQLQAAIEEIPAGLSSKLYSRSWSTIVKGNDRVRVMLLLRMVVFSLRPLTVREICEAILVSDEFHGFQIRELLDHLDETKFREKILDLCCSFLEVRKPSSESPIKEWTIHPVHFTVKEFYLEVIIKQNSVINQSDDLWIAIEHSFLAELCIKYMTTSDARRDSTIDVATSSNSFTSYAAIYWNQHTHAGMAQQTQQLKELIKKFFDKSSHSWIMWRKWFDSTNDGWANSKSDCDAASPLCYAIELGLSDLSMTMIKEDEALMNESSSSRTALGVACSKGNLVLARELLAKGAKAGIRDAYGRTAIYYAAMNGHSELVKLLIDHGADISTQDNNGESPFLAASSNGHLSVMRQLIQKGTNIHQLGKDGNSALFKACANGHIKAARTLIMKGAHRQLPSYTTPPIFVALKNGSSHLARLLIEQEKDPNATNGDERVTILHVAIVEGKQDIVKLLIDQGVDLTLRNADEQTPLFIACLHGQTEIAKLLIDQGVDPKLPDASGQTPLFVACSNGHVKIVKLLINRGVDLKLPDASGRTPFFIACLNGHVDIAKQLINRVDLMSRDNHGRTPLFVACLYGHIGIVKPLIDRGVNLMLPDAGGHSPFFAACLFGHVEIVKLLLKNGVNPTTPDKEGNIPLYAKTGDLLEEVASTTELMVFAKSGGRNRSPGTARDESLFEAAVEKTSGTVQTLKSANVSGISCNNAILAACQGGYVDVLQLLIEWIGDEIRDLNYKWTTEKSSDAYNIRDVALLLASDLGHVGVVALLLKKGANAQIMDPDHRTALYVACCDGRLEVAKLLIEGGANINMTEKEGKTPLMAACASGCLDLVKLLVQNDAVINATNSGGMGAAFTAAQYGHLDVLRLLLSRNADIFNKNTEGCLPIHIASQNGHSEIVNLLIENGSDLMVANNNGETPFWLARLHHEIDVVDVLLNHGMDVDAKDSIEQTPLLIASTKGDIKLAKLLLDHCADVSIKDHKGRTPLFCASANGHCGIVQLLLDHGADMTPNKEGQTPAYVASSEGHADILRILIDSGANVTKTDSQGRTLLHATCFSGHIELTKLLLEMGADINARNKDGIRPLYLASEQGHLAEVSNLIQKGAKSLTQDSRGWSLITEASSHGHTETVKLLIEEHNFDAEKPDSNGLTPLIAACEAGHVNTAHYLVDRGVNVNGAANGTTPLKAARSKGHQNVVKLLVDRGANKSLEEQIEVARKLLNSMIVRHPTSQIQSDAR